MKIVRAFTYLLILVTGLSCESDSNFESFRGEEPLDYFVSGTYGGDSLTFAIDKDTELIGDYGSSSGNIVHIYCHTNEFWYRSDHDYDFRFRVVLQPGADDVRWSSNYHPEIFVLSEIAYTQLEEDATDDDWSSFTETGIALTIVDKRSGIIYSSVYGPQADDMYFFGDYLGGRLNADFNSMLWNETQTNAINFKGALSLWID